MTYSVNLAPEAEDNLQHIYNYIALNNPTRAGSFVAELQEEASELLSVFPYSMRDKRFPDYPEIRIYPYKAYNVYYIVREPDKCVDIVSILRGSKPSRFDWGKLNISVKNNLPSHGLNIIQINAEDIHHSRTYDL